ncbi:MAG: hypothetical protein ABEJ31_08520 [Haloarculaceae archaeon]
MPSNSDGGEYPRAPAQKARDDTIVGVFESTSDPVLTTAEVAAELPIGKRATLNRLEDLVERGEIDSKDVGVGRVWWREDDHADEPTDSTDSSDSTDSVDTTSAHAEAASQDRRGGDATNHDAPAVDTQSGSRPGERSESASSGTPRQPPTDARPPRSSSRAVDQPATESPRWAFVGSLGTHAIYAGVLFIGLLLAEQSVAAESLLPVSTVQLFLLAVLFFVIGVPAYAAYRIRRSLSAAGVSLPSALRAAPRSDGNDGPGP